MENIIKIALILFKINNKITHIGMLGMLLSYFFYYNDKILDKKLNPFFDNCSSFYKRILKRDNLKHCYLVIIFFPNLFLVFL